MQALLCLVQGAQGSVGQNAFLLLSIAVVKSLITQSALAMAYCPFLLKMIKQKSLRLNQIVRLVYTAGRPQEALQQEQWLNGCACPAQVCAKAGLEPSAISYIEAHGTGTVAGDGQELGALEEWYGRSGNRTAKDPLLIGSVKSNMGHCEGCSGLAGAAPLLSVPLTLICSG